MTSTTSSSLHRIGRSVLLVVAQLRDTRTSPRLQLSCGAQLLYSGSKYSIHDVLKDEGDALRIIVSGGTLLPSANRAILVTMLLHRALFSLGSSFGFWCTENWCSYDIEDGLRNVNLDVVSADPGRLQNSSITIPDNVCRDLRDK